MDVSTFCDVIGADFYVGVPDSQLKSLCDYLIEKYGISERHMIAANEGNCTAIAAGYYLATGKVPVVYLQNSGVGNIINPVASLLNEKVYGIPCIFVIGWRGEPGVHDEPQHIFQGEVTLKLLEDVGLETMVISKETTVLDVESQMERVQRALDKGKSAAFVIKKGALTNDRKIKYQNSSTLLRETAISHIVNASAGDIIVSTTGKASRELYEVRERNGQSHEMDFLTVGSMGHCSSIALGIAMHQKEKKIWCIDGDGAVLMHMGAMAVIGSQKPSNLIHVVINNEAHESVGGMPTAAASINLSEIARCCGYENVKRVATEEELEESLLDVYKKTGLTFIEIRCAIGARENLGRPASLPVENKKIFMKYVKGEI